MKITVLQIYDNNGDYLQSQATLLLPCGRCITEEGPSTTSAIGACVERAFIEDAGDIEIVVKRLS